MEEGDGKLGQMTAGFGLPHPSISLFRLEIARRTMPVDGALGYNEFDIF